MKAFYYLYALAGCCLVAGCQHDESTKTAVAAVSTKPALQQPFHYHKLIEVAPGLDYDVLSWGRGAAENGSYMILRSDSVEKKFTTTNSDLDGKIVDVFNADLDTDGNPEIFVQSQTADSTGYNKIDAYEYNEDNARKLDFPKLTNRQKKGYHGGDDFIIKDNKLIRTYPIYDGDEHSAKPTGQKRTLEYSYHGNSFSVEQVSTDSTSTASSSTAKKESAPQVAKTETPAKEQPAKQEEHHSSRRRESRHHESRHRESRHHEVSRRRTSAHHQESSKRRRRHHR